MSKKIKKIAVIIMTAIILSGAMLIATGCSHGKFIEVDGWTLFRYNGNSHGTVKNERGRVNIISANSESLVADGVLNIPARIGKYDIHGFGCVPSGLYGIAEHIFSINKNLQVEHIVLAAELHVDWGLWGLSGRNSIFNSVKYMEFLSSDFMRIKDGFAGITYIIPDESMENFIERFGEENLNSFTIIEKSKFLYDKP